MPKTAIWFLPGDPRNSEPQYQIFPHLMWLWVDSKCAASFDGVVSNKKKSRRWKAFSEENRIGFPVKLCVWWWEKGNSLQTEDINLAPYTLSCWVFFFGNLSSV